MHFHLTISEQSLNNLPRNKAFKFKNLKFQISKSSMIQSEFQEMNYFTPQNNLPSFPANFGFNQSNLPAFEYSKFFTNLTSIPTGTMQEFSPNSTSNSTSTDEAEDQQQYQAGAIDERKQRRMISNRESARRSRMRKQRHLDELWSQVLRLRTENHSLIEKLNHVSESHDRVAEENVRLKEEASDLRQMLTEIQITNSYTIFRDLDDIPCNTAYLRAESSNQSVTTSTNLLH